MEQTNTHVAALKQTIANVGLTADIQNIKSTVIGTQNKIHTGTISGGCDERYDGEQINKKLEIRLELAENHITELQTKGKLVGTQYHYEEQFMILPNP